MFLYFLLAYQYLIDRVGGGFGFKKVHTIQNTIYAKNHDCTIYKTLSIYKKNAQNGN